MSLNVTSSAGALAALQALILQDAANQSAANQSAASQNASSQGASSGATSSQGVSGVASVSAASANGGVSVSTSGAAGSTSLYALVEGVGQATTTADAASAAGSGVLGLLKQLRQTASDASDPSLSSADRQALQANFQTTAGQIDSTLSGATVNGVNLVDGSQTTGLKVSLGEGGSASLTPLNLTLSGPTLGGAANASVATATAAASAVSTLGNAIGATGSALDTLNSQADQISAHTGFVQTLSQAVASPKDDGGDSVRLLALQLSQQLAGQTTSLANASPQSILSLFRS